jgi:curved DNA-binding protein CbpA
MNQNFLTYYQLLDVETYASKKDILIAYKTKAKAYHPDKNDGHHTANTLFQMVNQAKDVLTNTAQRLKYDYSIGVKTKPSPPPEEKIVYIREESNDLKEILAVGAVGLVAGLMLSKVVRKKKTKKRKRIN